LFDGNNLVSPECVDIFVEYLTTEVVGLGDEFELEGICRIPDGCYDEATGHIVDRVDHEIIAYPCLSNILVGSEQHPAIEIAGVLVCP
jgi:hypothetical protein